MDRIHLFFNVSSAGLGVAMRAPTAPLLNKRSISCTHNSLFLPSGTPVNGHASLVSLNGF